MDRILVYGLGGHSKVVRMMIKKNPCQITSIIADDNKIQVQRQFNLNVIHPSQIASFKEDFDKVIIAVGLNTIRKKLAEQYSKFSFATIIDETAVVAESVSIGVGTVIMPKSVINPSVIIGQHCIINTGSIVEHDCVIGDYSHISPGAVVTGGVEIGKQVHVGANATVLPGLKIGDNAIIGAGAVVTKDVLTESIMVGNPIHKLK